MPRAQTWMIVACVCACTREPSAVQPTPGSPIAPEGRGANEAEPAKTVEPGKAVELAKAADASPLASTRWSLVELGGKPPEAGLGGQMPWLEFAAEDARVTGFAGCNRMSGTYRVDGSNLSFDPLMLTRRACPQGMGGEQELARALQETKAHRITDGALVLEAADGRALAKFAADGA